MPEGKTEEKKGRIDIKIQILAVVALGVILLALLAYRSGTNVVPQNIPPSSLVATSTSEVNPSILLPTSTPSSVSVASTTPVVTVGPKSLVTAQEYLVGDLDTGQIYLSKDPSTVYPIASISKLLVALVSKQYVQPDQEVTITQSILDTPETAGELVLGEKLTATELLYPMLLESSNDAAEAYAQSFGAGYDAFIGDMNSYAAELGMNSTHFKDASGLSPENVSNANDLFTLARYLYAQQQPLLAITRTTQFTLPATADHPQHTWNTINPFTLDPHFIGGKTGRTDEALETMLSMFNYPSGGKTYHLAVIVLRSDFSQRQLDTSELFEQAMAMIDKNTAKSGDNSGN